MRTWVTCLAGTIVLALLAPAAMAGEDRPGPPQRGAFFERLDADKDGRVAIDDVPDQAPDWVRDALRRADRDRDGQVTREEIDKYWSRRESGPGAQFGRRPADQQARPFKGRPGGPPRDWEPGPNVRGPVCPWCGRGAMKPWRGWGYWGGGSAGPTMGRHSSRGPWMAPGGRGPAMHPGPWGPWHAGPMIWDRGWPAHRGWDRPAGKPGHPEFGDQRPRDGRGRWSPADWPRDGKPPMAPPDQIGRSPRSRMADPWNPDRLRPGREVKKSDDRPRPDQEAKTPAKKTEQPGDKKTDKKSETEKKIDDASKPAPWWK
jgi:hypothetical protein